MDYIVDEFYDNEKNYTNAINKAIKECSKTSGRVIFKANKEYISGFINLLDNVCLYFEDGAKLVASKDIDDFNYKDNNKFEEIKIPTYKDCAYNGKPTKFFIYANSISNIKICGNGLIIGNEEVFYGKMNDHHIDGKYYPRIPLIFYENVYNYLIEDIIIKRSCFWTIHLVGAKKGLIDNIKIYNNRIFACTDGIDPDHSSDLIIRNSYIESADDCVVFKSTKDNIKYGDTANIEVYNCTFKSTSAGVKFGSESVGDMYNIYIHDINILDSNRGISFQQRDEGNIYNIRFNNINIETHHFHPLEWWGKAEAIYISAVKRYENTNIGKVYNIKFDNIKIKSEAAVFIYGNVDNIYFNNIDIKIDDLTEFEKGIYDLRPYYSDNYLIKNDLYSFNLYNCNNIFIKDYNIEVIDKLKNKYVGDFYKEKVNNLLIE